ncbi:MAG: hypothetical protein JWQ42_1466 [Edaphobacter sp.]|nr:hypothetical protein [Edaphobacter sp.]
MKHLNEEELIEHYYGEAGSPARTARHLLECDVCADAYAVLRQDLAAVKAAPVPARDTQYGDQVWQSLRSSLPVYKKQKRTWLDLNIWKALSSRKALNYATVCAVLIAIAFFSGRQWEHQRSQSQSAVSSQPRQPIIFVVLDDHLDRSERLLIELNHADASMGVPVKAEASELLSANRLYRESATRAGDFELTAALDRLERVLVEIVNEPDSSSPAYLARLQKEMNTDGLLFEVRVLRSRIPEQQERHAVRMKGVSI